MWDERRFERDIVFLRHVYGKIGFWMLEDEVKTVCVGRGIILGIKCSFTDEQSQKILLKECMRSTSTSDSGKTISTTYVDMNFLELDQLLGGHHQRKAPTIHGKWVSMHDNPLASVTQTLSVYRFLVSLFIVDAGYN